MATLRHARRGVPPALGTLWANGRCRPAALPSKGDLGASSARVRAGRAAARPCWSSPSRHQVSSSAPWNRQDRDAWSPGGGLVEAGVDPDTVLVRSPPPARPRRALRDRLGLAVAVATTGPLARSGRVVRVPDRAGARMRSRSPSRRSCSPVATRTRSSAISSKATRRTRRPRASPLAGLARRRDPRRRQLPHGGAPPSSPNAPRSASGPRACASWASAHELPAWVALSSFFAEYLQVRDGMRGAHPGCRGTRSARPSACCAPRRPATRRSTGCGSSSSTTHRS